MKQIFRFRDESHKPQLMSRWKVEVVLETEMNPNKLNILCSYVACEVCMEKCDLGIIQYYTVES